MSKTYFFVMLLPVSKINYFCCSVLFSSSSCNIFVIIRMYNKKKFSFSLKKGAKKNKKGTGCENVLEFKNILRHV